jgi:hypothetical protein
VAIVIVIVIVAAAAAAAAAGTKHQTGQNQGKNACGPTCWLNASPAHP